MDDDLLECLIGFICGAVLALIITAGVMEGMWRTDAIDRGFAEYNQTTGEWQWKTNCYKGDFMTFTNGEVRLFWHQTWEE